ncbi:spore coat protein [Paenibacillus chartarius]|uniref:Spore coat protein n=1 Tax=Paenibacillus chartarius TaxID=747481 RepID=A0ABV6DNP6_9BACL
MMQSAQQGLALHETLELHELMTAKTVCLLEAKARQQLAQDPALKALIQTDIQNTTQALNEMQTILSPAAK